MLRRASRAVLATVAGTVLAGTLSVVAPQAAAAEVAPATGGLRYYGAQLHSLWSSNTPADVSRQLELLVQARANSARVDLAWSSLQTDGPGTINSSYRDRIDALVSGAVASGIQLILTVTETPCWASAAPAELKADCTGAYWDRGVTKYAPTDVADYAWVVRWVAARYGDRVAALELWNEPNFNENGYSPLVTSDPARTYAAMVKAAYPAAKSAAPSLPVLAGALSYSDDSFLKALYSHGIAGYYDGISVHPYNEWRAPGAAHDATWYRYDFVQGLAVLHQTMLAAGDRTPVWITEMGWTTCSAGADRWCVTAEQQGRYLAEAATLAATWPWVTAFIAYNLRDKGIVPTSTEDNFGLVRRDYTPKPALAALAAAFAAFNPAKVAAAATGFGSLLAVPAPMSRSTARPAGPWKRRALRGR